VFCIGNLPVSFLEHQAFTLFNYPDAKFTLVIQVNRPGREKTVIHCIKMSHLSGQPVQAKVQQGDPAHENVRISTEEPEVTVVFRCRQQPAASAAPVISYPVIPDVSPDNTRNHITICLAGNFLPGLNILEVELKLPPT